jgi:pimeloyl-ACP methyl ester carboxylesterase
MTHGWPGSVFEFLEAIGPLSDPASYGGSPEDAFDIIVPSLPGYGFSSKPKGKPIGPATTAALWNHLMKDVLGYAKYGAQGGDLANMIQVQLGRAYPNSLVGLHFNGIAISAAPLPTEAEQTPEERAYVGRWPPIDLRSWITTVNQRNKPQTVALALSDSPIGVAAWIVEKLKAWSDSPSQEPVFTKEQVITNVMIYLVTNTIGTAAWFYRGLSEDAGALDGRVTVPTGFASSPHEMTLLNPPRSALERNFNLVHYTKMSRGGHFAFWEQPEVMVADVRKFFGKLRT